MYTACSYSLQRAASTMNSPVYDAQAALARAGGNPDTARRFLHMLLDLLGQTETALADALLHGDIGALKQTAHRLAGAATYCGAPALHDAARRLEQLGREGHQELNATLVRELGGQIAAFRRTTAAETAERR